jgi:hypothetical protein
LSSLSIQAILVPQGQEYQAVCRAAKDLDLAIIPIPIGNPNFKQQLAKCLVEHPKYNTFKQVILLGLCGSLSTQHQVGDWLIYQSCKSETANQSLTPDLTDSINLSLGDLAKLVDGLECDRLICEVKTKLDLAKIHHTTAVDMESYQVCEIMTQRQIKSGIVRVVSDGLDFNLPNLDSANIDGKLIPHRLAIAMIRQPFRSIQLIKNALLGLQSLEKCTQVLLN